MKKKPRFYLQIIVLFMVVSLVLFFFNRKNRAEIESGFQSITVSEGVTIRDLVTVSGSSLLNEGISSLFKLLERLFENSNIIYIGLLDASNKLIFLKSKYEGYFPKSQGIEGYRFFKSPVGEIFEITGTFCGADKGNHKVYIGFNYEFLVTFNNNSTRNFLATIVILLVSVGLVLGFILYYNRRIYDKNLEVLKEKEDKERFKELSLLTSEIAHEIKNPLNSIYLSFNILGKYLIDKEDAFFYRDSIKAEILRISEIINSYSSVAKKISPNYQVIGVDDFMNELMFLKKEEMDRNNIEFNFVNSVKKFITDEKILKQILLNLLNNSIEAGANWIEIRFEREKDLIIILIKDNGKGIDEELLGTIFKPYISTKTKGMGLGLHITLKMLQAIRGDIEILSWKNGEKIFKIEIMEGGA